MRHPEYQKKKKNHASITTLSTILPSSSTVRPASSKACLAFSRPLNRWVTMSSRLGSAKAPPPLFWAHSRRMPVAYVLA